jgi:hypothetical protein
MQVTINVMGLTSSATGQGSIRLCYGIASSNNFRNLERICSKRGDVKNPGPQVYIRELIIVLPRFLRLLFQIVKATH